MKATVDGRYPEVEEPAIEDYTVKQQLFMYDELRIYIDYLTELAVIGRRRSGDEVYS